MELIEQIKESLSFGVGDPNLTELAAITVQRTFSRGEIVFNQGDEAGGVYLLVSGSIRLCHILPDKCKKILDFIMPGETFAEAALFGDGTYHYQARALAPCAALYFSKTGILELINRNPKPVLILLGRLSLMTRQLMRKFSERIQGDVASRLASFLVSRIAEHSRTSCGDIYLDLGIKKCELAGRLGVANATLSRSFNKLKNEGILEVRKDRVIIYKLEQLAGYAKDMETGARPHAVSRKKPKRVMKETRDYMWNSGQ
jgi:cAMP-binding proteins - catabolite gene activator and regulatory subunit of cAMP-dependent protein kinases